MTLTNNFKCNLIPGKVRINSKANVLEPLTKLKMQRCKCCLGLTGPTYHNGKF